MRYDHKISLLNKTLEMTTSGTDYGGYGEMAQKVIERDMSHVKWYAWEIEMAQF